MDSVKVNLKNCYGIRALEYEFIFDQKKTYIIYAQNGVMKSSLAQTFKDLSDGKDSEDRIYKSRETVRTITESNGAPLAPDKVFVIVPYNKSFKSSKISYLLANKKLKEEYDELHQEIDEKKDILVTALKKTSGLKTDIEETFSEAITHDRKAFYTAVMRVEYEVENNGPSQLAEVNYQTIFNDKVMQVLRDDDFRENLKQYITTYDKLVDNSTFFKKGVFNHNNAEEIAKNLDANGFFKASHTVNVTIQGKKHEISNITELKDAIQSEKDIILDNPQLAESFAQIDNKLTKNVDLRKFRDYLDSNRFLLLELDNIERLKQNVWVSYLIDNKEMFIDLSESYKSAKKRIESIISEAGKEKTKWVDVISIFNKRFSVPFKVDVSNKEDVILKSDVPNIEFQFKDEDDGVPETVDEQKLLDVLSNGERRALYILNIIFEVEARKEAGQETLFVIDDIADSFDYKNKYAIAEYLKDISEEDIFYQIILSHNFDFYRTMSSRLDAGRHNKLHAIKTDGAILLKEEKYQKNPFETWKKSPEKKEFFISLIPLMRNLAEYGGHSTEETLLTSLLHIKNNTKALKVKDIRPIMKKIFHDIDTSKITNDDDFVIDMIYSTADEISRDSNNDVELECKIVLAMAIRLKTEDFIISKINDNAFVDGITSNQTYKLSQKFKELFPAHKNLEIISEV
ncbi:hypothetical protein LJC31_07410, partial [Synergistaceae bacterium OttesenSCG-928-I11]|nr:hypothetical protein [Synergistaceae bacterium OttesenSCG-928-I11]